ncbi:MAG: hypothetical protein M1829_004420 [Trizodia sp. TS-e1964]|nr:MAG: hypothetical protein M1829_004420 [Trizodia sp. TS-e1964]
MTLLNSLLRATNFRNPFLRTLVPSLCAAYTLQAAAGLPSILAQTERYYDLSGSLTYLSCTALSLYLPALRARAAAAAAGKALPAWPGLLDSLAGRGGPGALNWRQVVLSAAVGVWAARLGSYLFQRVLADGKDSRFDQIKKSPPQFAVAFFAQATWVSLCLLPVLAVNSIPPAVLAALPALTLTDVVGLSLFLGGFSFEVTADRQKDKWVQEKKQKKHEEDFLTRGLWSTSRHPNYFGESTLWSGIAITAGGVLTSTIGQAGMGLAGGPLGILLASGMAAASPAFVTFLLLKISGVPLSEKKYDKKYGNRKDYQEWKRNTPMFIPKFW